MGHRSWGLGPGSEREKGTNLGLRFKVVLIPGKGGCVESESEKGREPLITTLTDTSVRGKVSPRLAPGWGR